MEDGVFLTSEQLNVFANLYFRRFHSLLPIIHVPFLAPCAENSLLFLSIFCIGSLFMRSPHAASLLLHS